MTEGSVVRVTAGKEKGQYFLVTRAENGRVWIVNGRRRRVDRPKMKNPKHLCLICPGKCPEPLTNRNVLAFLKPYTTRLQGGTVKCPKRI